MEKKDIFRTKYYTYCRILLVILGLWPEMPRRKAIFVQFIVVLSFFTGILPMWLYLIRVCDNVDDFITSLSENLVLSLALVKYFYFVVKRKQIQLIMREIRDHWQMAEKLSSLQILQTYTKKGYTTTVLYTVVIYSVVAAFNIFPMAPLLMDILVPLNETRASLYAIKTDHSIYGFDVSDNDFPIRIHHLATCVLMLTYVISIDIFIVMVIEHCCGLFEIIGDILQRIHTDLPVTRQHEIICAAIASHYAAVRLVNYVQSAVNMMYAVTLVINAVLLSLTGFAFIETLGEPVKVSRNTFFATGLCFHLLYLSFPGENLYYHSNLLSVKIYNCNWYAMSEETKKSVSIMVVASLKPKILAAGGIYVMNLENFGHVLKTSFSVFTVLLSMR